MVEVRECKDCCKQDVCNLQHKYKKVIEDIQHLRYEDDVVGVRSSAKIRVDVKCTCYQAGSIVPRG